MNLASVQQKNDFQVEFLETQLKRSLRPVNPDPGFVDHLHTRLKTPSSMVLENRENAALGLVIAAFSLLTGIMLVWLTSSLRARRNKEQTPSGNRNGSTPA